MKLNLSLTKRALATGFASFALSFVGNAAQAMTLLGNIEGVPSDFQFTTSTIDSGIGQAKAVQFTTPTTPAPLSLDSVELYLAGYDTADTPVVQIFQGTANSPVGGTTVNLSDPNPAPLPNSDPSAGANTVYSFEGRTPSTYEFLPDTTYTLLVTATSGAFNWVRDTASTNVTPTGLATFDSYQFRASSTASFGSSSLFNNFGITVTEETTMVSTPESSSVVSLLALGALGGTLAIKKRRNS